MHFTARLLVVIGCCCIFSACNLGDSEAEAKPAANSAAQDSAVADTPPVRTSSPSQNLNASALDDETTTGSDDSQSVAQGDAVVEPDSASTESDEPEEEADAEERYTYHEDHDPNGIGKFYMGREIAMVMGHQGIAWLERDDREVEEGLSLLIECLDIEEGSTVADIGAGSGVITVLMCDAVGEEGTVVAVDIQQEMLDALQLKVHEQGYRNVELVLGAADSPQLAPGTLDLVVMVDVYHEFEYPYEMLLNISQSLRPGGRIAFVEYRKEDPTVLIKEVHKMTEAQVRLEAEQPEFQLEFVETIDELPVQHVIVFRRIDPTAEQ